MEVILSTPARRPPLRDRRALRKALVEAAGLTGLAQAPGFGPRATLHVILVGTRTIARLNAQYLSHTGTTDVIAFGLGGGDGVPAGEVYICLPVAVAAAARYRTGIAHECLLYAVHGMLHLAGYDDAGAAGRQAMRRAERRALRCLREKADFGAIFGEGEAPAAAGA